MFLKKTLTAWTLSQQAKGVTNDPQYAAAATAHFMQLYRVRMELASLPGDFIILLYASTFHFPQGFFIDGEQTGPHLDFPVPQPDSLVSRSSTRKTKADKRKGFSMRNKKNTATAACCQQAKRLISFLKKTN